MPTTKLTPDLIYAAIKGYEIQKTDLEAKIARLHSMLPGRSPKALSPLAVDGASAKSARLSAAGRKAISEAARKRWAAFHAAKKKSGA